MKGLFFQNEIAKIDLFKNDVIMAEKTFLQFKCMKRKKVNFMGKIIN